MLVVAAAATGFEHPCVASTGSRRPPSSSRWWPQTAAASKVSPCRHTTPLIQPTVQGSRRLHIPGSTPHLRQNFPPIHLCQTSLIPTHFPDASMSLPQLPTNPSDQPLTQLILQESTSLNIRVSTSHLCQSPSYLFRILLYVIPAPSHQTQPLFQLIRQSFALLMFHFISHPCQTSGPGVYEFSKVLAPLISLSLLC